MSALSAFKGVQADTSQDKAALAGLIAQQGSRGAEIFKNAGANAQANGQAATAQAQGIGSAHTGATMGASNALQAQLNSTAAAPSNLYQQDAAAGAQAYSQDMGRLGAANSNYMSQVAASAPLVESQTNRQVQQILADLRDRQEQRAHQAASWARDDANQKRADDQYAADAPDRDLERKLKHAQLIAAMDKLQGKGDNVDPTRRNVQEVARSLGIDPKEAQALMGSKDYAAADQKLSGYLRAHKDADYDDVAGYLRASAKQSHADALADDDPSNDKSVVDPAILALLGNQYSDFGGSMPHQLETWYKMDHPGMWGQTTSSKGPRGRQDLAALAKRAKAEEARKKRQAAIDADVARARSQSYIPTAGGY